MSDLITTGIVCMKCNTILVSESGEPNKSDCPALCRECWLESPKKDRKNGLPYFDEKTGSLVTEQSESDYQTLEQWMDRYEAAVESGQSNISRDEAEKRYYKKYGKQPRHQNGDW